LKAILISGAGENENENKKSSFDSLRKIMEGSHKENKPGVTPFVLSALIQLHTSTPEPCLTSGRFKERCKNRRL
jgi:hypothetical protein